jgi:hypothetical protein
MVWAEIKAKHTIKQKTDKNSKKHKNILQNQIKHQEHDEHSNRNPTNTNHKQHNFLCNQRHNFVHNHA